jgi:hypothetical protein
LGNETKVWDYECQFETQWRYQPFLILSFILHDLIGLTTISNQSSINPSHSRLISLYAFGMPFHIANLALSPRAVVQKANSQEDPYHDDHQLIGDSLLYKLSRQKRYELTTALPTILLLALKQPYLEQLAME